MCTKRLTICAEEIIIEVITVMTVFGLFLQGQNGLKGDMVSITCVYFTKKCCGILSTSNVKKPNLL